MIHSATLFLAATLVQGDTVRLAERLCDGCSIDVRRLITIGDESGPGAIGRAGFLARDADGRHLLVHDAAPAQLTVYAPDGTYIRSVGRPGGGPGEYRRIWYVAPDANGVVVYDDFARRSTRLDRSLSLRDTRPAPETPIGVITYADGSGIMSAIVPTSELIGYALHAFDSLRTRTRSFGLIALPYREDLREFFLRDLARGFDGSSYWVSHRREYAFSRCVARSNSCRTFLRPAVWFPKPSLADPWDGDFLGSDPPPPPARLIAVAQDTETQLWVMSWVADANWRSGVEVPRGAEYRITDLNRLYDTVVERVDVAAGRVIASRRVDAALRPVVGSWDAWSYHETGSGTGQVEVVRFALVGKQPFPED